MGRTREVPTPKQKGNSQSHEQIPFERYRKRRQQCNRPTCSKHVKRRAGATGIWQKSEHVIDRSRKTMPDDSVTERQKGEGVQREGGELKPSAESEPGTRKTLHQVE